MKIMDFKQIEYFLEVAKTENISRAAKNLYVSQSTLSKSIKRLETELGVKLFERNKTGITITNAGIKLKNHFDASKNNFQDVQELFDGNNNNVKTLKIGMISELYPIFHDKIKMFSKKHPEVKLIFHEGTYLQLERDLVLGHSDICISTLFQDNVNNNIKSVKAFDTHVKAFCRKEDKLLENRQYSVKELEHLDLYSVKSNPVIDNEVNHYLEQSNCKHSNIVEVYGWRFATNMIDLNGGVVYLAAIFDEIIQKDSIISIDTDIDIKVGAYACYYDNSNKTDLKIEFCNMIKDTLIL